MRATEVVGDVRGRPALVVDGARPRTVVVRAGDTLGEIAQRFGTTTAVLQALNHLPDPDLIVVGQVLRLP